MEPEFKIITAINNFYRGLHLKYPICCIWQYVVLCWIGKDPAWKVWSKFNMTDRESLEEADLFKHVQCYKCMMKYLKTVRS